MAPTDSRPDYEQMRTLEDAAADNLEDYVLAYGKVAPQLDAQSLRVASGVAAFTGIGSPLTTVKGAARTCRSVISMRSSRSSVITTRGR